MSAMRTLLLSAAAALSFSGVSSAGTLFIAADTEDFAGTTDPAGNPLDRLGVWDVTGATVNSSNIINTNFYLNGIADGGGFLYAGTPQANPLNRVGFDGSLIDSIAAPGIPNSGCCNEEMVFDLSGNFYHAHYSDVIRQIDPATGNELAVFDQADVVGMAVVGADIWISKWGARSIGIWDPATNTYTEMFNTPDLAGALAYDPFSDILWVGMRGGTVTPYDLTGAVAGDSFQPFGDIPDTIDGLAFLGEVTQLLPEPGSLALFGLGLLGVAVARRRRKS